VFSDLTRTRGARLELEAWPGRGYPERPVLEEVSA
jgi:hypothetical protein